MRALIHWIPRVLGLAFTLFIAAFALDVFDGQTGPGLALALAAHLAPAAAVLAATLVGWRRPVAGGVLFALLGVGYILLAGPDRPAGWYIAIAGPAFVIGLLFVASRLFAGPRRVA